MEPLLVRIGCRALLVVLLISGSAHAQFLPTEVGQTVNGFQEDFDRAEFGPDWTISGEAAFALGSGVLRVTTVAGDPNHLLYTGAIYSGQNQEVLARVRVKEFGTGDPSRGGISAAVDPFTSQGINFFFRDEPAGFRHVEFLDDLRAWGTEYDFAWQNDTWYWLRLRHEPSADATDVFGKIWLADGSEPEPADWQTSYEYVPQREPRAGYAGIAATSSGGLAEFEVDYILIKAEGLPEISVTPRSVIEIPVALTGQPESQAVDEGQPVTFSVTATGNPAPTFQWFRNDEPIPGATNPELTFEAALLGDDGASFHVVAQNVVTNAAQTATSDTVTLTVRADTTPPELLAVQTLGLSLVQVVFSEPVALNGATNVAHYAITNESGAVTISAATVSDSPNVVLLDLGPLQEGNTYTLVVNGIRDRSSAANPLPENSTLQFSAVLYAPLAVGSPAPQGSMVPVPGGYDVTASGAGLNGARDSFYFNWQPRTGDFDVKIRVESLSLSDPWAEAGLVARASEAPDAQFAAALATPSISGAFFRSRSADGQAAKVTGSFPVNYPATWLRLRRTGNELAGFASFDGREWRMLGAAPMNLPETLMVGFGTAARNESELTTARFRDAGTVGPEERVAPMPVLESLGQSSRMTSLVISEILYHPRERVDGRELEFIEILNTLGTPENISGYRISGEIDYTFPPDTVIPGGGFLVIAKHPADVEAVHGITGVLGPYDGRLSNSGGAIRLRNRQDAVLLEVPYGTEHPWPVAADGGGPSLVLRRPSYGEGDPRAWSDGDVLDGAPGAIDPVLATPLKNVLINEILAHTDAPELDFIELYNHSNVELDLSGCILTDEAATNKYVFPDGSVIPARGFIGLDQDALGFALGADGERVLFKSPRGQVLDALRFGAQENGVAFGRHPDGGPRFSRLAMKTPGNANSAARVSEVVINEIMYHPISEDDEDQYIEIHNHGTDTVSLAGWTVQGGVSYTFPENASIAPTAYVVIARNASRLQTNYPQLNPNNTVGNFEGRLSRRGERIALARPDSILSTNSLGVITTNHVHVVVDEVTYVDGGEWGQWSDGGGSSLEKIQPRSDGRLAPNWADSNETSKAGWATVSHTGVLDHGSSSPNQLQVLLQGAGECLIDDVEVVDSSGNNRIANSGFQTDASGWTAEGTLSGSSWEGSRSYHVRAVDRGDNQLNRIRTPLTSSAFSPNTATIRAKVRWLAGHPEILFRLRGNSLEAVGIMDLPKNLGSPGLRNSRWRDTHAAAISEVVHSPIVPAAGEPIVVTARTTPAPSMLSLKYRLDPSPSYTTLPMRDDGTGGDAVAADGLYSATIPGQATGALTAFYVEATEGTLTSTFPAAAPESECLVRFGEPTPTGNFPVYRIWMTEATLNEWTSRQKLNNTPLNVTFVLGEGRVIYGATALYAGSPYISPGYSSPVSGRCGYTLSFPSDDRFLGDASLVLDWPGGHGGETTALQEQMGYWLAEQIDLPYSHRYIIRLHVNGVTDMQRSTVFEAVNQPSGDFVEAWNPDDDEGDFYKIDRAFEFSDSGSLIADPQPRLQVYTSGGVKKTARYRWNWLKRAMPRVNDYTNIFELVDAVNSVDPAYTTGTEALVDIDEWMGIFALEHIIANFDSYGHQIGKNMYAYKPESGKWQLYMFDLDWLMLAAAGRYPPGSGSLFTCEDPTITRMYEHPPFRRAYFQAVRRAAEGPMRSEICGPVMDAKYRSLVANNVTHCDGRTLTDPQAVKTWFAQRRTFLLSQLNPLAAEFAITSNNGQDQVINSASVILEGTAPLGVKTILVNGIEQPIIWVGVNVWRANIGLRQGVNLLLIEGYDDAGALVASDQVTVSTSVGSSPQALFINEWMAANSGAVTDPADAEFDDWFELYNPGPEAINLSDWFLSDRLDDLGARWPIPDGTIIPPDAYLLVWADEELAQNGIANGHLHADFKLSQNGEVIALFEPQGRLVDVIEFGPQTANVSQGRLPNGGIEFAFFSNPTPGAPNVGASILLQANGITPEGNLRLTWNSSAGNSYRVQWKTELSAAWADGDVVTATAESTWVDLPVDGAGYQFFRIEWVRD